MMGKLCDNARGWVNYVTHPAKIIYITLPAKGMGKLCDPACKGMHKLILHTRVIYMTLTTRGWVNYVTMPTSGWINCDPAYKGVGKL